MSDEATILKAQVVMEAKTAGVEAGIDGVKQKVKELGPEVDKVSEKYERFLKDLKEEGGKRSALGETLETLRGAGAVAGVAVIGEVIKDCTEKAAKLSEEFRHGKTDAVGLAVGIGECLPVIGGFVEAGQNIRELLTGEQEEIDQINRSVESGNDLYKIRKGLIEANKKAQEELNERMRDANALMRLANARTPQQRAKAQEENRQDATADKDHLSKKQYEETEKQGVSDQVANVRATLAADLKSLDELASDSSDAAFQKAIEQKRGQKILAEAKQEKDFQDQSDLKISAYSDGVDKAANLDKAAAAAELARAQSTADDGR